MSLFVSIDDYCVEKVLIAASIASFPMLVKKNVGEGELLKIEPKAKSMVLQTNEGAISQHHSVLRYIGRFSKLAPLTGMSEFDAAIVNQWLEFSWSDLEVPLQLLLAFASNKAEFKVSPDDETRLRQKAKNDIISVLTIIDNHVADKTFLVGERISLADISLYSSIGATLKIGAIPDLKSFRGLFRWYMTVGSMPKVSTIAPVHAVAATVAMAMAGSTRATFQGKWNRGRVRVKELLELGASAIGREVTLKGWVRTSRSAEKGQTIFVELTDGSTVKGIQLVLNATTTIGTDAVANSGGVGASLSVTGTVVESPAKGQVIEIHAKSAEVLGAVYGGDKAGEIGAKNYPMAKKEHSLEFLREKAHLRPRSKVFSSAMRVRHAMAFATHKFFNDRGFVYTHTPLITAADCEGAGEQFAVTSLLPEHAKGKDIPLDKAGNVDFSKDFFGRRCCLTVSGQLNVETHACALSDVYTFGPTFRAENSHTARHLAEFWMIEPEICFADLSDDMALAEDYVRFCTQYALENCADDLEYFEEKYPQGEKGLRARLRNVANSDFARITYTEAVALVREHAQQGKVTFEKIPMWGDDLGSEHERYLAEKIYQRPTIVINYPKGIKAFYMKMNPDNETVAAMDILVPKIGELIGGSQREDNLEILERRCVESGLRKEDIWWYADLRKFGTVPHAGFGLGFERLIMFITGLENIRDVIPFPRVPGHAEF